MPNLCRIFAALAAGSARWSQTPETQSIRSGLNALDSDGPMPSQQILPGSEGGAATAALSQAGVCGGTSLDIPSPNIAPTPLIYLHISAPTCSII